MTTTGVEEAAALGRALAGEPLDLRVVTPLRRMPGLTDPRAGRFGGKPLDDITAAELEAALGVLDAWRERPTC